MKVIPKAARAEVTVAAPPSKAHTLRALFLAALAEGRSVVHNPLLGEDQRRAIECLQRLGVNIRVEEATLTVEGAGGRLQPICEELYVGESGVCMNFLTALACLSPRPITVTGDESPAVRSAAITMLGRLGVPETADTVMQALADENPEVRQAAVHAVADMDFKDGCSDLAERLHDPEAVVRRAAVEALTALEATDAAPAIARLIMDQDHRVANTAMKCLEAMDAVDVLQRWAIESISNECSNARVRSAKILMDHPAPDAADVLVKALDDEASSVSYHAALALAKLGRSEAVPVLRKMRDTHNEIGYLQWAAAEALEQMGC